MVAPASRFPVDAVIAAHHPFHFRLFDASLKSREIAFCQILFAHYAVKRMPAFFRPGMGCKVLYAGCRFQSLPLSLQAFNKSHPHPGGKAGVLPIGFVPPSPSRVSEKVDIRRPEGKALIQASIPFFYLLIIFRPSLRCDDIPDFFQEFIIKRSRQANRLGKYRSRTRPGHSVKGFIPPIIIRNPQPLHRRSIML